MRAQAAAHVSLFHHQGVPAESARQEAAVRVALAAAGVDSHWFWDATLYHPSDLPLPRAHDRAEPRSQTGAHTGAHTGCGCRDDGDMDAEGGGDSVCGAGSPCWNLPPASDLPGLPPVMTNFRKLVDGAATRVRAPLPPPASLPRLPACFAEHARDVPTSTAEVSGLPCVLL